MTAMIQRPFSYWLSVLRGDGSRVSPAPVSAPSPKAAVHEWVRWHHFCTHHADMEAIEVSETPIWKQGIPPILDAILYSNGEKELTIDASHHFASLARSEASRLVVQGLLQQGEPYGFQVEARPDPTAPPVPVLAEYPLAPDAGDQLDAELCDVEFGDPEDHEVHIPDTILRQAVRLATIADHIETGGVLIGRLTRPPAAVTPLLTITALVSSDDGQSGTQRAFRFTPAAWSAARTALRKRGSPGEAICGWWHSHPDLCNPECPEERRRNCALRQPFFSDDDIELHSTMFPAAFSIGLLIANTGTGRIPAIFGWRAAAVVRRSFHRRVESPRPIETSPNTPIPIP